MAFLDTNFNSQLTSMRCLAAREMEASISTYMRRASESFDLSKNIEVNYLKKL